MPDPTATNHGSQVIMRVVNFLGAAAIILVVSLALAPYVPHTDANLTAALCTLTGGVIGYLAGFLSPAPNTRPSDARSRASDPPTDASAVATNTPAATADAAQTNAPGG